MAPKKRIQVELLALGIATATLVLFSALGFPSKPTASKYLTVLEAYAESALYLDSLPKRARLHIPTGRWQVSDGHSTAWLDARTGKLIMLDFEPMR